VFLRFLAEVSETYSKNQPYQPQPNIAFNPVKQGVFAHSQLHWVEKRKKFGNYFESGQRRAKKAHG